MQSEILYTICPCERCSYERTKQPNTPKLSRYDPEFWDQELQKRTPKRIEENNEGS